jgi:hypothetical protein
VASGLAAGGCNDQSITGTKNERESCDHEKVYLALVAGKERIMPV